MREVGVIELVPAQKSKRPGGGRVQFNPTSSSKSAILLCKVSINCFLRSLVLRACTLLRSRLWG